MRLTSVNVCNYKGLRETSSPLSDFVCAIGENNTGKSSLLQALLLFINGTKLSKAEFYDPGKDIVITVSLGGITQEILAKLTEEHRTKIVPHVIEQRLVLARRYSTDGSSKLRLVTYIPRERKYHDEQVDSVFKGKKGKEIGKTLTTSYPEVATAEVAASAATQKAAKDLIQNYVEALASENFMLTDIPLPTGIDNSIRSILPEPVYIPAVKDLSDDLKTKESASFGKLLNILLDVIEDDLTDTIETFENLRRKLNRVINEDGTVVDERMDKVKAIEETIQKNLQETFRNVAIELEIPPPQIKTVLSNATIVADDGVRGPIENKGDGFKRAITFSILRSYVELSQDKDWRKELEQSKPTKEKFLFLFEETELYLHPRAQNILFDALSLISKKHQVVVTTHSPLFFSADNTTTFLKVAKRKSEGLPKPFGECLPIDLTNIGEKDKFQLISFETTNIGFFSNRIVLVEGDSELIALPHIAKLLNPHWDFKTTSTSLVKINGKGSFKRYKEFFSCFGVNIALFSDLDILLDEFDKIEPSPKAVDLRNTLLKDIDDIIDRANMLDTPLPKLVKEEMQRERAQKLYSEILAARASGDVQRQGELLEELFAFERTRPRLEVLRDHSQEDILRKKRELIVELRSSDVFVLEKGAIESYYPKDITGRDKPTKAQSFCAAVTTGDQVKNLCELVDCNGVALPEFEIIMKAIFNG